MVIQYNPTTVPVTCGVYSMTVMLSAFLMLFNNKYLIINQPLLPLSAVY